MDYMYLAVASAKCRAHSTHQKDDICCSVWKISIIKDRYRLAEDIIRNQFDLIMIVIEERTTAAVILTIQPRAEQCFKSDKVNLPVVQRSHLKE